jgi:hypothetical protein
MRLKQSKLRIWRLLLAVVVLAVVVGAGTGIYFRVRGGDGESIRVVTAVQVPYPAGWSERPLSEADRNAGLLMGLERAEPEASFLSRTVIARLATDFDIDELADDTVAALSAEIDNFDLVSKGVSSAGPFDVVLISYRQMGQEGLAGHRNLMAIVPTPNQTFYLTLRAEEGDFRQVEREGLKIIAAFVNYVGAALQ